MVFVGSTGNTVSTTTGFSSRMVTFTGPDLLSPAKPTAATANAMAAHAPRPPRATGKRERCCMGTPILALTWQTETRLAVFVTGYPVQSGDESKKGSEAAATERRRRTGWRPAILFASFVFLAASYWLASFCRMACA